MDKPTADPTGGPDHGQDPTETVPVPLVTVPDPRETARAIGRATAVIVGVGLLDKLLALAKEMLMAARFGADAEVDAFNIAYAFPGIVNLMINGAFVSAFVPLFAAWRASQDKTLARDTSLTILAAASLLFPLIAWSISAGAPLVLDAIGYGFPPDTKTLAVGMERSLAWLVGLEGVGILAAALLQNFKRFGMLTLAQMAINLTIIVFLSAGKSLGIKALILGFLVGTVLKVALMFASLRGCGVYSLTGFRPRFAELGNFVRTCLPFLGGTLIANSNILVDQSMTTVLPAGAVAVLRYAYRMNDLPLQVVVIAVSRAIFPYISEQAAAGDNNGLRHVLRLGLVFMALICAPITCYVLIFAQDVVVALLRRGAFDAQAASQTALTLRYYSLGLFFSAYAFINGAFYSALLRGGLLLRIGLLSLGLNFGLNWLFLRLIGGPEAIALSSTITIGIISCIFFAILRQLLGNDVSRGLGRTLAVVVAASAGASAVCWPLRTWAVSLGAGAWMSLIALTPVFGAVYVAFVAVLRTRDVEDVARLCLPRLGTKA